MDCRDTREKLSAYLDGELPAEAAAQVRGHLSACPACTAEADALKRLEAALDMLPGVEAPADFARRVREMAETGAEETRRRRPVVWRLNGTLARAAAVLVAVGGASFGLAAGRAVGRTGLAPSPVVTAEADDFDLQAEALSVPRASSVAGVYLALVDEAEPGGWAP